MAHLIDIASVGNAERYLDEFVLMVACQVLEVLAEQVGVEDGHDAAVEGGELRALVGDAFDLAGDAVTFDIIAYAHTSAHQRNAIEEVLEQALRGKTHTSGEAGNSNRDACTRHIQHKEDGDDVDAPND